METVVYSQTSGWEKMRNNVRLLVLRGECPKPQISSILRGPQWPWLKVPVVLQASHMIYLEITLNI